MSLVLNVEILGEYKDLTRATKGAQGDLNTLDDKIGGFSKSAKAAFLSIGAGLSFAFIAKELGDATKAAAEDVASQKILEDQLRKSTKANDDQIASVEKSITKLSIMSATADDKLRPALSELARATGDVNKAQDLLALALDISAGTGKDLDVVTKALAKSMGPEGTTGALEKLVPAIKGAKDPMGELEKLFGGTAKLAGDTKPYERMQVVFGEMQETIGMALLPKLMEFSDWLASPKGEETLQAVTDTIVGILDSLVGVVDWVGKNKEWLAPLVIGIAGVTAAFVMTRGVIDGVRAAIGLATAAQLLFNAASNAPQGLGALGKLAPIVGAAGVAAAVLTLGGDTAKPGTTGSPYLPKATTTTRTPLTGLMPSSNLPLLGKGAATVINVNVKNVTDAPAVIKTLSQFQKSTGTTLSQALR